MPRIHLTYNEFGSLAEAVAKGLKSKDVVAEDRVAIILDNSEWAAPRLRSQRIRCSIYCHVYQSTR